MIKLLATAVFFAASDVTTPDGSEWQDETRQSLNREPVSTLPVPADAIDLSGVDAWRFKWVRRPSERPVGFEKPDYDVSKWDLVTVPSSWQACGIRSSGEIFGKPVYLNIPYPFTPRQPANRDCPPKVMGNDIPDSWTFNRHDNPVGSYRRDFEIPAEWLADDIYIRFGGVESFYYFWINGKYVGFAKDSRSPSAFNITKYLNSPIAKSNSQTISQSHNSLSVEVYRHSDGSYLEDQDIFRLSGILRPVKVFRRAKNSVRDIRFETHPEVRGKYDGDWILTITVEGADAYSVDATIPLEKLSPGRYRARHPKLWSAEEPNLYRITVAGNAYNLGFREVEITEPANPRDRVFLVNGRPVKLKGVNHSEVDPVYGHHQPLWRTRQDLELIKKGNFNHVRLSHCPRPDEYYDLCDELGLYVMDEANVESHGMGYGYDSLSFRPSWEAAHLTRQINMVSRNRNHPSIIMWSMGNEAGPGFNFRTCYEWIRKSDPTRPVNYERNWEYADLGARQYPSLYWLQETAAGRANVKYPFHVNEFLHNLNNNAGGIKSFQDAIESSDRICGGAIWDFVDQGLLTVDRKTGRKFYGFGGDFGESPSDGQGILDGIIHADRTVEPAYHEARHAYQPFDTRLSKDGRAIIIESKYYFRDSSAYELRIDGRPFAIAPIRPREKRVIPLSTLDLQPSAFLKVEFVQREAEGVFGKGWVIAADQIKLPDPGPTEHASCVKFTPPGKPAVFTDTGDEYVFAAGDYRYRFSKKDGSFVSIERNGVELLEKPVFVDAYRGPVGGDMALGSDKRARCCALARLGLHDLRPSLKTLTKVTKAGRGLRFATIVDWRGRRSAKLVRSGLFNPALEDGGELAPDAPGYHVATEYIVFGDGSMKVAAAFRQFGQMTEVPRIGYRYVFRGAGMNVEYKARGPWDNYVDRNTASFVGTYSAAVKDLVEKYGRTCEYGNRTEAYGVRYDRTGLTFAALYDPLAGVDISEYSPMEMYLNPHPELLPAATRTELGLYAAQAGIGSANCGPQPETQCRLDPKKTFSCEFLITPEKTLDKRTFYEPYGVKPVNFEETRTTPPGKAGATARDLSRPERLALLSQEMFGEEPPTPKEWMFYPGDVKTVLGGRAVLRTGQMRFCTETRLWKWEGDLPEVEPINWMIVKPKGKKNCPVVIFLNYRGNHEYLDDLSLMPTRGWVRNNVSLFIVDNRASELTRGKYMNPDDATYVPLAEIIDRGYAVVTASYADFCADACVDPVFANGDELKLCYEGGPEGPNPVFRWWKDPYRYTALGLWAWGLSRGLDLAASDPDLDITRSIVTGCSRLGKAALLAGARDERFAVVAPVQTGGGGVPLLKHYYGENAAIMNFAFPHWYCENFRKYTGNEAALPFDMSDLLACVAPRRLLVNGFNERMYDPKGEELSVEAARPEWKKLGAKESDVGYRRRNGRHGIEVDDWRAILDFAGFDKQGGV